MGRLTRERKLMIWHADYLHSKYLFKNIESAISKILEEFDIERPYVLDIGCGHNPYASFFKKCNYIAMDRIVEDSSPDLLGSALDIPFEEEVFDIVFSTQVIEHVPDPQK